MDYKELLASIARDKGDIVLSEYILAYKPKEVITKQKYNITLMPEATCDGCQ